MSTRSGLHAVSVSYSTCSAVRNPSEYWARSASVMPGTLGAAGVSAPPDVAGVETCALSWAFCFPSAPPKTERAAQAGEAPPIKHVPAAKVSPATRSRRETVRSTCFMGPPYAKCLPSRVSLPWSEAASPEAAFFLRLACQPFTTPIAAGMAEMAMISTSTSSKCSCTKGTPPKK